jgi:hypothetical protein
MLKCYDSVTTAPFRAGLSIPPHRPETAPQRDKRCGGWSPLKPGAGLAPRSRRGADGSETQTVGLMF